MKYQVGEIGRVVVARFDDSDDILDGLVHIARREDIRACIFYLVGGIKDGRIVVGPETDEMPPVPAWRSISESHEMFGLGTIFWYGDEPLVHFHGAYGKHDLSKVGCLREKAGTFLIIEGIILEIKGVLASRQLDALSNMVLLNME